MNDQKKRGSAGAQNARKGGKRLAQPAARTERSSPARTAQAVMERPARQQEPEKTRQADTARTAPARRERKERQPEGFLAVDGILDLCLNVVDGLVVYPKVIEKRLRSELPFMATENIMMDAVKAGGDRQELHERIRTLSMEAGRNVKEQGLDNNLLELIAEDPAFNMTLEDLQKTMDPAKYTGRAEVQVESYLKNYVRPVLEENKELLGVKAEINV